MTATELFVPLKQLSRADKLKVIQYLITELANEEETCVPQSETVTQTGQAIPSALELAGDLVGCLDSGLGDLSTNPAYMEGFGS